MTQTVKFNGFNFSSNSMSELIKLLIEKKEGVGAAYHLVNSYTLVIAEENPKLKEILMNDILICDGKPLSLILKLQRLSLKQIRGSDLLRQILSQESDHVRHFFLGSTDKVLDQLIIAANEINPEINIAGKYSPSFKEDFEEDITRWVEIIRLSAASIVWIGLGTPKQDFVSHELAKHLDVHFVAVGAAFDFIAGNKSEAPKIFIFFGLEWFFRLISEPKRLFRRYFVGNFKFLLIIFRQLINKLHTFTAKNSH